LLHPPDVDAPTISDTDRRDLAASNQLKTEPVREAGGLRELRDCNQLRHNLPPNGSMLPDEWVGDVGPGFAIQSLGCAASSVGCVLLSPSAQKSNAAQVTNAHKKVQIQQERLCTGKYPAAAPVLIPKFDFVRRAADDLA
jgi:hypothetical protein